MAAAQSPHSQSPYGYKVYQFDAKQNIFPVELTIDEVWWQLRIERVIQTPMSPTSPESPLSPLAKKPRRGGSLKRLFSFSQRLSSRSSSEPTSPTGANSFAPDIIPFGEIKEFRYSNFDQKNLNNQILKQLKIDGVYTRKIDQVNYKLGILYFGTQFNLNKHNFLFVEFEENENLPSSEEDKLETKYGKKFVEDVLELADKLKSISYFDRLDMWFKRHYDIALEKATDNHRLKIWKQFLSRCHCHVPTQVLELEYEELRKLLLEQNPSWCSGRISKEEFEVGARYFLQSSMSINKVFQMIDQNEDMNSNQALLELLTQDDELKLKEHPEIKYYVGMMTNYLKTIKVYDINLPHIYSKLDLALETTKSVIKIFAEKVAKMEGDLVIEEKWLSSHYVLDYLFSEDNSIWNPEYTKQYQNMDHPLAHYWISSSHNTYLTGDQYSSESSVEPYAIVLKHGCRCIEIDVWNGPFNKPMVKHGMTLTTSVPLKDVLKTVKEYAFIKTPYPLIISIENHCNMRQQKVMAKYFRKIFGKSLITTPVEGIESLPSPNDLKNKIIIKGRRLPSNLFLVDDDKDPRSPTEKYAHEQHGRTFNPRENGKDLNSGVDFETEEPNPCDCLMTGELWKSNEKREWIPGIFVLTNQKLFYIENQDADKENLDQTFKTRSLFRQSYISVDSNQDLHVDQLWFHGKILGGRVASNSLLQTCGQDGAFLVRDSETQRGEYTLCFYENNKVHHCHINSILTPNNERKFFLKKNPAEHEIFSSLYELIEYYKRHPVVTNECRLEKLGLPVPSSESHETQEWFYKHLDRKGAEAILEKLPLNGAFLARYSSKNPGQIVISFRFESVIKHCMIQSEGRHLMVANLKFLNLEALKEHYARNNFYKDIKLSHQVDRELYKKSQQSDWCSIRAYGDPQYLNAFVQTVKGTVRAIQSYPADDDDPEYLSFKKGDKIVNVVKEADGWWWGIREDQMGKNVQPKQFCSSFVEECEELDGPFGDSVRKGTFNLGVGVKWKLCKDKNGRENGLKFYLKFKDPDGTKRRLGAKCSKRKISEWVDMINYVVDKDHEGKMKMAKIMAATKRNIAPEYSDLIVYCSAMDRLCPDEIDWDKDTIDVTLLKSFDEDTGDRVFRSRPNFFVWYHQYAMTRIYPKGIRLNSSNLSPVKFWNFGSQMVALNWQTDDKMQQINRGKFRQNGQCGYVLKPDILLPNSQENTTLCQFDPTQMNGEAWNPITLKIEIISARHLQRPGNGPIIPTVIIEIFGVDADCKKASTSNASINTGLNPRWNQSFTFKIHCEELALLQFAVCHVDTFNDKPLLGECTIPVPCLREGYRSVQLNNSFGEPLFSILLVKITKEKYPVQSAPSTTTTSNVQ